MRKAVYTALKSLYPVYHAVSPTKKAAPPYLLLTFGSMIKSRVFGTWQTFTVTAFAPAGDMETLDTMCEAVITALDDTHLARVSDSTDGQDGSVFLVEFDNVGEELPADAFNAVTKDIDFRIPIFGNSFM
ncbi:MAG: hypothetical protein P1P65_00875 [Treponema sp.]